MPEIPDSLRWTMRTVTGIQELDLSIPLHRELVDAILTAGQYASLGQQIVACRFVFNWRLTAAGREFARRKADYDRARAKTVAWHMAQTPPVSAAKANVLAEADDNLYQAKLDYLVAEQEERAMRKFLDTLDAALNNHRTDRADQRSGDRAAAQGYGGGA